MKFPRSFSARSLSEIAWVVGGQAVIAIGTLVGVRLLTQFLSPTCYGLVSLALGVSTVAIATAFTPLIQAAMHFYPAMAATGSLSSLRDSIYRCLQRVGRLAVPISTIAAFGYFMSSHKSRLLGFVLMAIMVCEWFTSLNLAILNSARRQRRFALWVASLTWARPLVAIAAVGIIGESATAVLSAYLAASVAILVMFHSDLWSTAKLSPTNVPTGTEEIGTALDRKVWSYASSLIPLGLIGWIINLGDRYIIGGVLGLHFAGVYAAVYGLSSVPLTIIGGTIEQAVRPVYQHAVSTRDCARANVIFVQWLVAVAAACAGCIIVIYRWHNLLAELFLGPQYRRQAGLMPWIAAGYGIRCIAGVFERVCYAYGGTSRVLLIQCSAAAATIVATPTGIYFGGLKGAAAAVPIYFGVQLIVSALLSHKFIQNAGGVRR